MMAAIEKITSAQNQRVKRAAKLRDRRGRMQQHRIIIDGLREISRAIASGVFLDEVFVSSRHMDDDAVAALLTKVDASTEIIEVVHHVFEKLMFGHQNAGVVAVAKAPHCGLDILPSTKTGLIGVVEGIEKPGNLGAVLRTADGAGVDGVIVCDAVCDLYNPNAIRSSLGTIFSLPVCTATAPETMAWLSKSDTQVYVARVDGSQSYSQVDFTGRCAIVLGSEAKGVSPQWRGDPFQGISLPMLGIADSLNISASAAVLFYEALRQRRFRP